MKNKMLSQNETKKIMVEILKEIKLFCQKAEIPFFLIGGTLLGAIRHKGFIPWDDDIDIAMFRCDYEKFIRDFKSDSGNVKILSMYSTEKCRYPFAKAIDDTTVLIENNDDTFPIGVYVDVFPIDSLCDDLKRCKNFTKRLHRWKLVHQLKNLPVDKSRIWYKNLILIFIKTFLHHISDKWFIDKFNKSIKKFQDNNDSIYVANLCGAWGEKEITLRSDFDSFIEVEFEGEYFPAPVGYDTYLKNLYDNYMQLPPKDKQASHHNYKAYKK